MYMIRKTFLLLLSMALFSANSAEAIEILYPQDKGSFVRPLFIVNTDNQAVTAYRVAINGLWSDPIDISDPQYEEYFRNYLILPLPYAAGKNKIEVQGLANGNVVERAALESWFLDAPFSVAPDGWEPFVMHTAEREARCASCHEMNPDSVQMGMKTVSENPCGGCHYGMLEKDYVHGPAGTMDCVFCHDTTAGGQKYVVGTRGGGLCLQCHDDKGSDMKASPFTHGPVMISACTLCHSPHSSAHSAQLVLKVNDLCVSCHDQVPKGIHVVRAVGGNGHPLEGPKNPAEKGKTFNCASCHDPHFGKGSSYFRYGLESRFALCQKCHNK